MVAEPSSRPLSNLRLAVRAATDTKAWAYASCLLPIWTLKSSAHRAWEQPADFSPARVGEPRTAAVACRRIVCSELMSVTDLTPTAPGAGGSLAAILRHGT
jgi:hypothetical protein